MAPLSVGKKICGKNGSTKLEVSVGTKRDHFGLLEMVDRIFGV